MIPLTTLVDNSPNIYNEGPADDLNNMTGDSFDNFGNDNSPNIYNEGPVDEYTEALRNLDADAHAYLHLLRTSRTWTRVESNCLCFPDIKIQDEKNYTLGIELEKSSKKSCFIHVYRNGKFFLPDCSCDYGERLGSMLLGGYVTDMNVADELEYFEVGDPCIHAR